MNYQNYVNPLELLSSAATAATTAATRADNNYEEEDVEEEEEDGKNSRTVRAGKPASVSSSVCRGAEIGPLVLLCGAGSGSGSGSSKDVPAKYWYIFQILMVSMLFKGERLVLMDTLLRRALAAVFPFAACPAAAPTATTAAATPAPLAPAPAPAPATATAAPASPAAIDAEPALALKPRQRCWQLDGLDGRTAAELINLGFSLYRVALMMRVDRKNIVGVHRCMYVAGVACEKGVFKGTLKGTSKGASTGACEKGTSKGGFKSACANTAATVLPKGALADDKAACTADHALDRATALATDPDSDLATALATDRATALGADLDNDLATALAADRAAALADDRAAALADDRAAALAAERATALAADLDSNLDSDPLTERAAHLIREYCEKNQSHWPKTHGGFLVYLGDHRWGFVPKNTGANHTDTGNRGVCANIGSNIGSNAGDVPMKWASSARGYRCRAARRNDLLLWYRRKMFFLIADYLRASGAATPAGLLIVEAVDRATASGPAGPCTGACTGACAGACAAAASASAAGAPSATGAGAAAAASAAGAGAGGAGAGAASVAAGAGAAGAPIVLTLRRHGHGKGKGKGKGKGDRNADAHGKASYVDDDKALKLCSPRRKRKWEARNLGRGAARPDGPTSEERLADVECERQLAAMRAHLSLYFAQNGVDGDGGVNGGAGGNDAGSAAACL